MREGIDRDNDIRLIGQIVDVSRMRGFVLLQLGGVEMRAGRLRHRVRLQRKTAARDSYGAEVETWSDLDTIWASVEPISGREYFQVQQVQSEITHRIRMRYYSGLRFDDRILWGVRIFNIKTLMNIDERNAEMVVMATEFAT